MLSFTQFMVLREARQRQKHSPTRSLAVIIFKRKATRMFPDGQEVSSYYSDEIKKTVLFPNTY